MQSEQPNDWKLKPWRGTPGHQPEPVPPHLDFDMWLGPAPQKPYNSKRVHAKFRGYWDYDGGGLGDMGQHYLDPVQYILGKDGEAPDSVDIDADPQDEEAVGVWRRIEFTCADGCKVILNGTEILNANLDELAKAHPKHQGVLRRSGHIAFLGHRSIVAFRNIRIAEIK